MFFFELKVNFFNFIDLTELIKKTIELLTAFEVFKLFFKE